MPRSKHRRKAGGKSVQNPGRSQPQRPRSLTPAEISGRYFAAYVDPFYQPRHPEYDYAGELLDIVSYATFDIHTPRFYPASNAESVELSDGSQHVRTSEEAETALRYLVKKKMVVVDGDLVSAHPRFAYPRHQGQAAAEEVRAEMRRLLRSIPATASSVSHVAKLGLTMRVLLSN
jgi:hypothetical protein